MRAPSNAADLSVVWLARSLAALAPAIRALPDMVILSPELLSEACRTADVIQRLADFLKNGGGARVMPRRRDAPDRRSFGARTPDDYKNTVEQEEYSPCKQNIQALHFAAGLDRHADALLFLGLHAAAERVSHRAAELRGVAS